MPTMLWRSEDAPHVTILGSIHASDEPLPPWSIDACDEADLMVFEAEPGEEPLPLPNGETISGLAPAIGRAAVQEAALLGLDPQYIDSQFPFRASVLLGLHDAMKRYGLRGDLGVETVLRPLAKEDEVPGALEEPHEVFRTLFYDPPIEEQLAILWQGLVDRRSGFNPLDQVVAAWRRCDPDGLWSLVGQRLQQYPAVYDGMFRQRHSAWIGKAVEWIEWTRTTGRKLLLVVGCLHLTGPDSFLKYLAEEGYTFQRQP